MDTTKSLEQNLTSELRRGTLLLMVLGALKEPQYGYSLIQHLDAIGMKVDQNTLYPLLRRLEKQGLVDSEWQVGQSRPRRYYRINDKGIKIRAHLLDEWDHINQILIRQNPGLEENHEKLD
jgi:DNA-binding PadR family transcriptional regulator